MPERESSSESQSGKVAPREDMLDLLRVGVPFSAATVHDAQALLVALEERARLAEFTSEVALSLSARITLGEMLQKCCEALVRHLHGVFARIWTLSADDTMLELEASAGLYTHLDGAHSR